MAGLSVKNYSYKYNNAEGNRVRSTGGSIVDTGNKVVVGNPGTGAAALTPESIRAMVEKAKTQAGIGLQAAVPQAPQLQAGLAQGRDQIRALVQQMAAERGWTGPQWEALHRLIMKESGYNPEAQNPTSTAFGIFQFLNKTWAGVGAQKTHDAAAQIRAGLQYIAQRYRDPSRALQFHLGHNWY